MNRTIHLTISTPYCPETESAEAQIYFANLYPGIQYIKESDSFLYRGILFDYFKSGIIFPIGTKNEQGLTGSYLLVDPENYHRNWLFTYGDKEIMWREFIERKNRQRVNTPTTKYTNQSFIRRMLNWL